MKAYGAEDGSDKTTKATACRRDPQRQKRRALKKKRRTEDIPPTDEPTRRDYGFDKA